MTQDRGTGDLIDDRFRLMERLGSGAMGAVWRALDEVLQREVALKQVRPADPGLATDPDYAEMLRTRVLREARALARIDHPHVVTIHHVVVVPGEPFPWLVMELVRGGTLEDRLAAGPMRPAEVAELGRGLLGGLRAAHAAGICHRDVKPANVLLRPDGSPVLTDFGIADLADTSRLTATGGLTGSPAYIAPERLYGSEGNPASDLWSLGMLLYVAVEGRHPLRQTTAAATLAAVMSGVVPVATRAGRLDPALRAVLVADPAGRAGAEQLDALLIQALDPGPPGIHLGASAASATSAPWPTYDGSEAVDHGSEAAPSSPPTYSPLARSPQPRSADRSYQPPPGEGSATVERRPGPPARGTARKRVLAGSLIGGLTLLLVAAIAGVGLLLVPWIQDQARLASQFPPVNGPSSGAPSAGDPSTASKPSGPASSDPTDKSGPEPEQLASLHTEKGMDQAIKALKKATGTTKYLKLIAYPNYAIVDVPVKGRKGAYDRYMYDQQGQVKLWSSGSDQTADTATDVDKIDWDLLPRLMKRADETLNLPKPESRYVIVDPGGVATDGEPSISIYLSDKYASGYLTADFDGNILDTRPAP
ncbi:serine/threonine-protein kinase [Microlunatus speluncae]|uniref:serine/threonine-protein kinase n=1 Tax=Microlunatus speluncae TaxID=2594267 RepID=UPI001C2D9759|nr:serine/threonine-protein kinase [Microlunatus speluncae]